MGKKTPKAPTAAEQAAAQGTQNKETAFYNAQLQNMDQITPYGSLTYQNLGTLDAPKWQSTVSLSPEQQKLFDTQMSSDNALASLGGEQIGRIRDAVSNPYSYDNIGYAMPTEGDINTQSQRAQDAYMARLQPQFDQDEAALRSRLINQGIQQGSQAYNREFDTFNKSKNDALSQAVLASQQYGGTAANQQLGLRNQAINEYNTVRNAPLNEYTAMTSGQQITNPQFSSGGNAGIQSFDMAGAMKDQYSNAQAAANNRNAATSQIFGLGGQALGAAIGGPVGGMFGNFLGTSAGALFSDARLKENIAPAGKANGHNLYAFNYKGGKKRFVGVMAQDIIKSRPDAIGERNGFMTVDYEKLGLKMMEI